MTLAAFLATGISLFCAGFLFGLYVRGGDAREDSRTPINTAKREIQAVTTRSATTSIRPGQGTEGGVTKRMHVYRDNTNEWRWRLWSSSDIVAESGESHPDGGYAVKKAMEFKPDDAELEVDPSDEGDE